MRDQGREGKKKKEVRGKGRREMERQEQGGKRLARSRQKLFP